MIGEGGVAWPEAHGRTGRLGIANHFQRILRLTVDVSLGVHFAFTADNQLQFFRQGVNDGNTHAMQTAGDFVRVIVKFTAGMKYGHDDLSSRNALFFVNAGRNTTTIILYGNRVIRMDRDLNLFTVAREGFVDSVVHNLEYHVVQTSAVIGIADIHAGALTHRVQPF